MLKLHPQVLLWSKTSTEWINRKLEEAKLSKLMLQLKRRLITLNYDKYSQNSKPLESN